MVRLRTLSTGAGRPAHWGPCAVAVDLGPATLHRRGRPGPSRPGSGRSEDRRWGSPPSPLRLRPGFPRSQEPATELPPDWLANRSSRPETDVKPDIRRRRRRSHGHPTTV